MKVIWIFGLALLMFSCTSEKSADSKIITRSYSKAEVDSMAAQIIGQVKPEMTADFEIDIWAVDSLSRDPIGIDMDNFGRLYYTRTDRQANSEFDIRGHRDWETDAIRFQTVEDRREFIHKELSKENSDKNEWLDDVNGDGFRDWKDLTIEKNQLIRLEDKDNDGRADYSVVVSEGYNDEISDVTGAIAVEEDNIFLGVGPDMWRLKDKNGDGVADEQESIAHGFNVHIGFSGHGMSGAIMGPDGKIYWGIGDPGFNGVDKEGKKHDYANMGVIVRSNPDGSDFEVYASGLRNTHEFVFDQYGNIISEDNDGDHRGESERLVYITYGSDAGWRINWQFGKYRDPKNNTYKVWMDEKMFTPRWDKQPAYITPCIRNYVNGPTGMLYNPGTALSEKYNNTFFLVEFVGNPANSGIHAFKLKPKGATFDFDSDEKILSNFLPTGLTWGPDGAMYVGDWVNGWNSKNQGRIWKFDVHEALKNPLRKKTDELLKADFSKVNPQALGEYLTYEDMRVRQKAQFELAKRREEGLNEFKKYLSQGESQLARIHSIWGIAQMARAQKENAATLTTVLSDADEEIRAQAAKWLGDIRYTEAASSIIPMLKDSSARVRFFAAEALGRMEHAPAFEGLVELLASNNNEDAYIRHAASLALASIKDATKISALSKHPSASVRMGAVLALRRMQHKSIALFLNDGNEDIVTEAARAINDDHSIVDALADLAALLGKTTYSNEALIRRVINANNRVGDDASVARLIAYAKDKSRPEAMRVEALATLSVWAEPSVFDRVDGRYRGVITRDLANIQKAIQNDVIALLSDASPALRKAASFAYGDLQLKGGDDKMLALLAKDKDAAVRGAAFTGLVKAKSEKIQDAVTMAINDKEAEVRSLGLEQVTSLPIDATVMQSLLEKVVENGSIQEQQTAILSLGKLPAAQAQASLEKYIAAVQSGGISKGLLIELQEAVDTSGIDALKEKVKLLKPAEENLTSIANFEDCLEGGNAERGRNIMYRNQTAQCVRCHAVGDYGGNAGPNLSGVGGRLSRMELLQSLIEPSAVIAPGFGYVSLDLKDGSSVGGIMVNEDQKTITLREAGKDDMVVLKENITDRTNGASSMPAMGPILSKREIRDIVAALAELQESELE